MGQPETAENNPAKTGWLAVGEELQTNFSTRSTE
jgi:hypothetical protein